MVEPSQSGVHLATTSQGTCPASSSLHIEGINQRDSALVLVDIFLCEIIKNDSHYDSALDIANINFLHLNLIIYHFLWVMGYETTMILGVAVTTGYCLLIFLS